MNGVLSWQQWLVAGLIVGVVVAGALWLIYATGIGNFLLTAVSGPDRGGLWVPVVEHTATLSSGETVYCYDDGSGTQFCERSGFTKSKVLGYLLKDPFYDVPMHTLWSCAGSVTGPESFLRVTLNQSDCTGSGVSVYRLGYTFANAADVPDAPPVGLAACTRGNAVRVVGNSACTDNGFGQPQELGYVAPAGDQLLSLCSAMEEACQLAELSPFCLTTLENHCQLAAAVTPSPTASPTPTPSPTPTSTPTASPTASPTATPSPTPSSTPTPTPTVTPTPVPQGSATLFVTSKAYASALGGLAGADDICQSHASAAGLAHAGEYRAILSDSRTNAKDRFEFSGPIRLVNGVVVAQNEADLWDGSIAAPVNVTERGDTIAGIIWTGTDENGLRDSAATSYCGDWTGTATGVEAGRFDRTNGQWISIYGSGSISAHSCENTSFLYCIGPS